MSEMNIEFGTAGWRGIIADDFTYDNVRIVSQAIADFLNNNARHQPRIFAGYDSRFMGEKFARTVSEVMAANGVKVFYSVKDIPTPAISQIIISKKLDGGINITASHNPPEYSGIKFSPSWGGPALPATTGKIEENCTGILQGDKKIKSMEFEQAVAEDLVEEVDWIGLYNKRISELIDTKIIQQKCSVVYDAMNGTGRDVMGNIIPEADLKVINGSRDVLFGGHRPEPAEEFIEELKDTVKNGNYDIGLATDGDGDRFGIVDEDGTFITPNQVMGLALYHLCENKKYSGVGVRSVMTSSFMDAVGKSYGVEIRETPVGFKYIGDISVKEKMVVGGEESGGLTIGGHLPEKDGILACLLMAELRAIEQKSLGSILADLYSKVGKFVTARKNFTITEQKKEEIKRVLAQSDPDSIGKYGVKKVVKVDGYKYILDAENSWLGIRFSGTEPVIRLYAESNSEENIEDIISSAQSEFL
ncbi:MAG: phosphoglucomutase/phosphomannomutase family protein [Elusimicrobiota bacterium]